MSCFSICFSLQQKFFYWPTILVNYFSDFVAVGYCSLIGILILFLLHIVAEKKKKFSVEELLLICNSAFKLLAY